ncbi:MAG: DUF7563 family protein [Halobacteriota archaeon]
MADRLAPAERPDRCLHCGSSVSVDFRRVFGDCEDRAHRCWDCDTQIRIDHGSGPKRATEWIWCSSVPTADGRSDASRSGDGAVVPSDGEGEFDRVEEVDDAVAVEVDRVELFG